MMRLVEGSESNFKRDEHCDDNLSKNEISDAKKSALKRQNEDPTPVSSTNSTCRRNELTDSSLCLPTFSPNIMSEDSVQISGDQRRYRENLRIGCHMPRLPRSLMYVIFIVILLLVSTAALALAIFTSLKVARLEDSSLFASGEKAGNEQAIDCEHIQEMKKEMEQSLTDALRELQETKEILGILKNSTTKAKENETAASAHTLSPVACNLSLCSYKRNTSTGIASGPDAQAYVLETEPKDMKFLGVNCGTNDAIVVSLSSTNEADGRRSYKCSCKGTVKTSSVSLYCYIHYWECPI